MTKKDSNEKDDDEVVVDPLLPSKSSTFSNEDKDIQKLNQRVADLMKQPNVDITQTVNFTIQPETLRVWAYILFWAMAFLAITLTELFTRDKLLKGLEPGEPNCPPFERFNGQGFDLHTDSHLIELFGFNNICSTWDYSPSREIVALFYPVFEYALILYIVGDFATVALAYHKGWVSQRYWIVMKISFPIMVLLCSWFRMIFVLLAYQDTRGHTAGFLGLQIVLMMVACLNVWYIVETKTSYKFLGGLKGTRICGYIYLVLGLAVSFLKFASDAQVVLGFPYPGWGLTTAFGGMVWGQVVDIIWMVFNAILPLIIACVRSRQEQPLEFTIDMKPPNFVVNVLREEGKLSKAGLPRSRKNS